MGLLLAASLPAVLPSGGVGVGVEDVVHHLEQQSDQLAVVVQRLEARLVDWSAAVGAEQHRGADQRAGLVDVHVFQFAAVELAAHGFQVDGLAAGHAARAEACPSSASILSWRAGSSSSAGVASTWNASVCRHRRRAAPWLRRTACTVGLPRRSTSSSMQGMSSCTSE